MESYKITHFSNGVNVHLVYALSFGTIKNYIPLKPNGWIENKQLGFGTIKNYITLKDVNIIYLGLNSFGTIKNYTPLKHLSLHKIENVV